MHMIVQIVSAYLSCLPGLRSGIHARIEYIKGRFSLPVGCMDPVP